MKRIEIISYIGLMIIGVLMYFGISKDSTLKPLIDNISGEIVVIGIIFFLFRLASIDPVSNLKDIIEKAPIVMKSAFETGVSNIYVNREMVPTEDWLNVVLQAKKEVGILAVALTSYSLNSNFMKKILELNNNKENCRILLINPNSNEAVNRGIMDEPGEFFNVRERIMTTITTLFNRTKDKNVDIVRLHSLSHTCDIVWGDDIMYITNLLAGGPGGTCPCIKIEKKSDGLFDRYVQHFNALWKHESTKKLDEMELN